MWMMEVAVDQVVNVIAVGNLLVSTVWAVHMSLVMSTTLVTRRASVWIRRADFKNVFVNLIGVCVL
jgi:hypothetical protein